MNLKSLLLISSLFFILGACKTQEEIQREQMVDNMSLQMIEGQKGQAEMTVKYQALEEQVAMLRGELEQKGYNQEQKRQSELKGLEDRVNLIEESQKDVSEKMAAVQKQLEENKEFLNKVLKALGSKSAPKAAAKPKSPYWEAMDSYQAGKYKEAKDQLLALLNGNKVNGTQKARVLHNLGMIEYMDKKNDDALIYFSKLFTEFSSSGYNKNGLLFLGKTFNRMGRKEEAKQTLEELVKRFPKSKQVDEAKKLLQKL
ncbi:MAG: tetratricopeptide repeat protein [Deltaproteobacteria bacterium]|nr:MAG: tetratricopeptide repeat protein [Deltaproteobacteria bacterium]